jgi:hypothetical protein
MGCKKLNQIKLAQHWFLWLESMKELLNVRLEFLLAVTVKTAVF